MIKKRFILLLCACFAAVIFASAFTYAPAQAKLILDGQALNLDCKPLILNGTTYIPLRSFAESLGNADIAWDNSKSAAVVKTNVAEITVCTKNNYIQVGERYFYAKEKPFIIDGRIYAPIRPIAKGFEFGVEWNAKENAVILSKNGDKFVDSGEYYNEEDLLWLSRIIYAESGAEPFDGQIAVGNVVLNRVKNENYPNDIKGVIFDENYGVQFEPVSNNTVYNNPSELSVIAAKICLEGYTLTDECIYFLNIEKAKNLWIVENCRYVMKIGEHSFYA